MNFIKHLEQDKKQTLLVGFGYITAAMISLIHVVPINWILKTIGLLLPIGILILFLYAIFTNLKVSITDIAITFFGICYIVLFLMYLCIIHENLPDGKYLIWYVFFVAWGTDIFALVVGKLFGNHPLTEISPKKTIEGAIGGLAGAVLLITLYTLACEYIFHVHFSYITMLLISLVLSVLSQVGDLAASSVKRYCGIKDFSNLIPGHGGMLDRIDSIIFIAPFAYFLFMLI